VVKYVESALLKVPKSIYIQTGGYQMTRTELQTFADEFTTDPAYGFISVKEGRHPDVEGIRFYDSPLIGAASADNEYYKSIADNEEASISLAPPEFWLSGAKTVISFYFPFDLDVRRSNYEGGEPSLAWKYARVQGQKFLAEFARRLQKVLTERGYETMVPVLDERFWELWRLSPRHTHTDGTIRRPFSTNWSERHAAFGAGLGTFGLSGNFITEKGTAGRLISVITKAEFEDMTPIRALSELPELYDNCVRCDLCVPRCPAGSIGEIGGKDNAKCTEYLQGVEKLQDVDKEYKGSFGCGFCQVDVPCESANPARK
jgi:epoxyqueuosine reductase QueG